MRTLLKVVGVVWAIIGAGNILGSAVWSKADPSGMGAVTVIMFNVLLFIIPGLILGGLGGLIKQKEDVKEKKCPYCAETIKLEASVCRFCSRELTAA